MSILNHTWNLNVLLSFYLLLDFCLERYRFFDSSPDSWPEMTVVVVVVVVVNDATAANIVDNAAVYLIVVAVYLSGYFYSRTFDQFAFPNLPY